MCSRADALSIRSEEGGAYRPPAARRDEGSRREEGPRHDEGGPRRSEQRPPESRAPPAARKEDERKVRCHAIREPVLRCGWAAFSASNARTDLREACRADR